MNEAQSAFQKGLKRRSDFNAARYLGLCQEHPDSTCVDADFDAFIKQRKLAPKAFLPADWDPGFITWFEKSVRTRWGVDALRVREKQRSFEIAQNTYENKYVVTVVATPELEVWYLVENGMATKPLVIAMGSSQDKPTLFFGKIVNGSASFQSTQLYLDTRKKSLHYLWKPEFEDLDGDGKPEVWIRYNLSSGNGFSQFLEVYQIRDERELVLIKRFEGSNNGYAVKMPDHHVDVAQGVSLQGAHTRLDQSQHRVEAWEFRNGEFHKTGERMIPFLLKSPDWSSVYLNS